MKQAEYKIYKNREGDYKAVFKGWSWLAFFLSFIWALINRLWLQAVITIVLVIILGLIGSGDNAGVQVITIIINIIFGFYGNKWIEGSLLNQGYVYTGAITSVNRDIAIADYMRKNIE